MQIYKLGIVFKKRMEYIFSMIINTYILKSTLEFPLTNLFTQICFISHFI